MNKNFDCVVMLTMSDWHTEPRSNRYHYAIRFAREVPTFFVQFDRQTNDVEIEKTEYENLYIIHVPAALCERDTNVPFDASSLPEMEIIFNKLGGKRWLIWSYHPYCTFLFDKWDTHLRVYHATEIYLIREPKISHVNSDEDYIRFGKYIKKTLAQCDLVVSVASGAEETIRAFAEYKGDVLRLHNGCDDKFWIKPDIYLGKVKKKAVRQEGKSKVKPKKSREKKYRKTVFYQGGVNHRLDFNLLNYAAEQLPDWKFVFCGQKWLDQCGSEATRFFAHPNVEYVGLVQSEKIRELAGRADVGIIPFVESYTLRNALPLKAYEYVACGLPVVTTPVNDLIDRPDLFSTAFNKDQFVDLIKTSAKTRFDRKALATRLRAARKNSYDGKFRALKANLSERIKVSRAGKKLNILVLYCEKSTANRGLRVSLEAIKDHSKHNVYFLTGTTWGQSPPFVYTSQQHMTDSLLEEYGEGKYSAWDFSIFDAVVVHYSVRLTFDFVFSDFIARQLHAFNGPKLLYIQDEYEKTEMARKWMDLFQFEVVYTCVPDPYIETIYPKARFKNTRFVNVLTGYVTQDLLDRPTVPLEDRSVAIAYRGRKLSHRYGKLGYEKRFIGQKMREYAEDYNIPVDIEWEDKHRIYDGWLEFLGSPRATLATESGSNMFDFDGNLNAKALQWADVEFEDAYEEYFEKHDNLIQMAQISPKVFEAISLKTALICFEGEYSGVIKPNIHYISLKKDFSNIKSVLDKLMDDAYITKMVNRAYKDIILSGKYSIETNVAMLDADIESLVSFQPPCEIISAPIAIKKGDKIIPLQRSTVAAYMLNDIPYYVPGFRKQFLESFDGITVHSDAVSERQLPTTLLYNEISQFSPYDNLGNVLDASLREARLLAKLRENAISKSGSFEGSEGVASEAIATPQPATSTPAVATATPTAPLTALDRLLAGGEDTPIFIKGINKMISLERFAALKKQFDGLFLNEGGSTEEKRLFANHIVQYLSLASVTKDANVLYILAGLTKYYSSTQKDRDIDRLYDLEFVLRKMALSEAHRPYVREVIDTMIKKEQKAFDPRLYMGIYYYFQLYYTDEKMAIIQKAVNSNEDNVYKRMVKFGVSQETVAKEHDKKRNIDNSYMAKLFEDLSSQPAKQKAIKKAVKNVVLTDKSSAPVETKKKKRKSRFFGR